MFSLKDYLDYKAVERTFIEMRKKNAEIQKLKTRVPYIGPLKHIRPEPVIVAPVNELPEPVKIPSTPRVKHIVYPKPVEGDVYVGRIGYLRKMK